MPALAKEISDEIEYLTKDKKNYAKRINYKIKKLEIHRLLLLIDEAIGKVDPRDVCLFQLNATRTLWIGVGREQKLVHAARSVTDGGHGWVASVCLTSCKGLLVDRPIDRNTVINLIHAIHIT